MLHRLLERQISGLGLQEGTPPSQAAWKELLNRIGCDYQAAERERYLLEHSIEVASREMEELKAKLSREHGKLTGILQAVPVGLAIVDREGRVIDRNSALEEILGRSPQETTGRFFWDFLPAEEVAAAQRVFEELISGRLSTNREQRRMLAKGGHVVLANVGLTAVRDDAGKTQMVIASIEVDPDLRTKKSCF